MSDLIDRQTAIDAVDSETVSTNPEHFKSSEKFIKFMKDVDIASFGEWKWANGFNTALVATTIRLKALPSAQPEILACGEGELNVPDTNVGDMISRQAAIDALGVFTQADALGHTPKQIVEALPPAQPEIVRCKDCKHYLHDEEYGFDWCNRMSGVFRANPDGFCSWAVMRGGDTE